jgi:putative flavoprotein involved in K+ transport
LAARLRPEVRRHGGPLLRVKRADLARAGVELAPARTVGVRDGRPVLVGGAGRDAEYVVEHLCSRQPADERAERVLHAA